MIGCIRFRCRGIGQSPSQRHFHQRFNRISRVNRHRIGRHAFSGDASAYPSGIFRLRSIAGSIGFRTSMATDKPEPVAGGNAGRRD